MSVTPDNDISPQRFMSSVTSTLANYENKYDASLEKYLSSLWVLIKKYKNRQPSYSLFSIIIREAFETPPCTFNKNWLSYQGNIIWDYQEDTIIIEEYKDGKWIIVESGISDFEIVKRTILFQIADLHRLTPEQLQDRYRYFGITSLSGAKWYNLDAFAYWGCAIAGMEVRVQHKGEEYRKFSKCNWALFSELLTLGQLYE